EKDRLRIERMPEEFPRACTIRGEPLLAAGWPRGGDEDRGGLLERRIPPEGLGDVEAAQIGHLGIEDDRVWSMGSRRAERLATVVSPDDGVAFAGEDALERAGGPLLIIGDEHDRLEPGGVFEPAHEGVRTDTVGRQIASRLL